jgi:adenylate cyclase
MSDYSMGPISSYTVGGNIVSGILVGILAGLLGGGALVFAIRKFANRCSFRSGIVSTIFLYTLIFLLINTVMVFYFMIFVHKMSVLDPAAYTMAWGYVHSPYTLLQYFLWGLIMLATQFLLQVSDKFGPGVMKKLLFGEYLKPRDEDRIFMFVDLKSSTSIAEKIGHEKYFNLLNNFFADITEAVIDSHGEIYQYVGDEIVVSWPLAKGTQNANCLKCFIEMRRIIQERASFYEDAYGTVPEFKAGLHAGQVTAGEIGVIKKDIVYSGDVLNTASRIQEECNKHNVSILLSDRISNLVSGVKEFVLTEIGEIELRGKQQKVGLSTLALAA